ncbi:fibronectin type III domain-containing protein [Persicobacter diffluens]|uniref:Uncharacterized protein n=1 Tax=Persicobacter diffluens TaxID=981 RepID=A0AAN4W223_9BACT|nr:hypothetical protein PEDI_49010 [Persicobacter diffluens]
MKRYLLFFLVFLSSTINLRAREALIPFSEEGGYSYFRVTVLEAVGDLDPNIAQLEWRADGQSYPIADYLVNATVSPDNAGAAYDKNPNSLWGQINSLPASITLAIPEEIRPDELLITPAYEGRTMASFIIEASADNALWVEALAVSGLKESDWTRGVPKSFTFELGPPPVDEDAPTAPTQLMANYLTANGFLLSWEASTDNVGVVAYDIFQDNVKIGSTAGLSFQVEHLTEFTSYSFYVTASDAAGNISDNSQVLEVTTPKYVPLFALNSTLSHQQIIVGDLPMDLPLSLSATIADAEIATISSIDHQDGDGFAVLNLAVNGQVGETDITLSVSSGAYSEEVDLKIQVKDYDRKGWHFGLYDVEFWKEEKPDASTISAYQDIIDQSRMPYDELDWDNIPLTVGIIAGKTKKDYFTSSISGYIKPPKTGNYRFHFQAHEPGAIYFSNTAEIQKETILLYDKWDQDSPTSDEIYLEEGKVYGVYGVHHQILGPLVFDLKWSNPEAGISEEYIPAAQVYHMWDDEAPAAPAALKANIVESYRASISWEAATDNQRVIGYKVYLNGIAEEGFVRKPEYQFEGLAADTQYSVVVQAFDEMGNLSLVSSTLQFNTFIEDHNPPSPPTSVDLLQASGVSMKIGWSGAHDAETAVVGYFVYVNDQLYSPDRITADSTVLTGLMPEHQYEVTIVAQDASGNLSVPSEAISFSTTVFDPDFIDFGDKVGKISLLPEAIAYNTGFGINPPYVKGEYTNSPRIQEVAKAMHPSLIRWGAIDANSISFAQAAGTGKTMTYGELAQLAIEANAAYAVVVGVADDTDYMTDSEATFTKLMDYLGGDETTQGGQLRIAEGFDDPFLPQLSQLVIELGNEVWGGNGHNSQIGRDYKVYREWCRDMANVIKSHPAFDPDKVLVVISGRYPDRASSYDVNRNALTGDGGEVDVLGVSGYLSGDFNYDNSLDFGETELKYYQNRYELMAKRFHGMIETLYFDMYRVGNKNIKPFYIYETNATTSVYNGRTGQALMIGDYMCNAARLGNIYPTLFHLTAGEWRITNPEDNYSPRPLYTLAKTLNEHSVGDILNSSLQTKNTLVNDEGIAFELDPVGHHFYKTEQGKYALVLFSRDFEHNYTLQLDIPSEILGGATAATVYELLAEDYSANAFEMNTSLLTLSDGAIIPLQANSVKIIEFEGEDFTFDRYDIGAFKFLRSNADLTLSTVNTTLIEDNKGKANLVFKGGPEDFIHDDNYEWMLVNEQDIEVEVETQGLGFEIQASGSCAGNGEIKIITTIEADGVAKSDELTIEIKNQGGNCGALAAGEAVPQFTVSPNPTTGVINVDTKGEDFIIRLFNTGGRLVHSGAYAGGQPVDIRHLPAGVYILNVLSEGQVAAKKIIKK